MRLSTARNGDGARLYVETPRGMLDVVAAAPELDGISDVGNLLRAGPGALEKVSALIDSPDGPATVAFEALDLLAPIPAPQKIICVGLNYRRHAEEGGDDVPGQPILFAKFANAVVGGDTEVVVPRVTQELDYEGELGVVVGSRAVDVPSGRALEHVAGYVVANDISARDLQDADPAGQWFRGKALDGFAPMGPYFVTADEVDDWRALQIRTWVNGELRQDEHCGDMVFGVEELIAYVSQGMALEPGDVLLTGTPAGVGAGFTPPRWLASGDLVEVEISGLGRLRTRFLAPA